MQAYDVIVIGVGAIGSGALHSLAKRGVRALGIERFQIGHCRGSSHGQSRIIRQAYFEHPDYVPLLKRAYCLWDELETSSDLRLFYKTGLIEVGPPNGTTIRGVKASAEQHGLEICRWTSAESQTEFPQYAVPQGCEAVFECNAGFLLVEQCVKAMAARAQELGAEILQDTIVRKIDIGDDQCEVHAECGSFACKKLIVTAGAWFPDLLSIPTQLEVRRKHLDWFSPKSLRMSDESGCPAFFYETNGGYFYGMPAFNKDGVKVAEHSGGETVDDPLTVDRSPDPKNRKRVENFVVSCLPEVSLEHRRHDVCMYTMSPDEHFIVDHHPDSDNVWFATGLSGHGFKFAPAIGESLADLAVDGTTDLAVDFLRLGR